MIGLSSKPVAPSSFAIFGLGHLVPGILEERAHDHPAGWVSVYYEWVSHA